MKIGVTGGAGFVGSLLVPELLKEGYEVAVIDNLMYKQNSLMQCAFYNTFEFINGDIRNHKLMSEFIHGKDIIIHLAAIVGEPRCKADTVHAWTINEDATSSMVMGLRPEQKIIYPSTGSVYGKVVGVCDEEHPTKPLGIYGQTKLDSEKYVKEHDNNVIYRYATGFGISPRLRLDLMPNDFAYKAVNEGYIMVYEREFRRTFIHVKDMVRSYFFAIENFDDMKGEIFNVGSEKMNCTKEDIALAIKSKHDYELQFTDVGHDPDQRDYEVSYQKIRDLGFETEVSLDKGVDELVRAMKMLYIHNPYSNMEGF